MSATTDMTKRTRERVRSALQEIQKGAALQHLPLDAVVVVSNIRGAIDESAPTFVEFIANIKQYGVQEPILVRPAKGGKYELIAGERRWRGSRRAGLATIPALVKPVSDDDFFMLQVIENIHRENLSQLKEAEALREALTRFGTLAAVAKKWNRSKGWASERLQLLDLKPAARALIEDNVTADVSVINSVNRVAKIDRQAGDDLAARVRGADKKREVARRGLDAVKKKAGQGRAARPRSAQDWGREAGRLASALASSMQPASEKAEQKRQVRAIISGSDERASGVLEQGLKAAHAAGRKLATGWQAGLGGSLSLLAMQLDADAARSPAGRALVLKAFALGAMKQPYAFETIVVS